MKLGTLPPADLMAGKEWDALNQAIKEAAEARDQAVQARNRLNQLASSDEPAPTRADLELGRAKAALAGTDYEPTQFELDQVELLELRAKVPQLEAYAQALQDQLHDLHASIAMPLRGRHYDRTIKHMETVRALRQQAAKAEAELSRLIAFDHWLITTSSPAGAVQLHYQETAGMELPPRNWPDGDD